MNRWSDAERARYYASGIWDRRGLFALLRERATETPDKLAFHDGYEGITYAGLEARARALATAIEPRSVVAVQMGNTIEHVVTAYAVAAAAAVLFEIPPDSTPQQVDAAVHRTRATRAAHVKGRGPFGLAEEDTEAVALLIGTSGTTGTPKIAMRSMNGSCAMARHVLSCTGIGRDDVVLIAAPLSGGVGYINGLCSTAITGCSTIIPRELKIEFLMELLERHAVTAMCTLPTLTVRMLAAAGDAPALRVIQTGGAYLHPQVAARLEERFGCHVVSAYGAIDVGIPSMVKAYGDTAQHRHETVGRPFPEVELALIDGEVAMRGPSTALGYFEDEAATRAVYDDDGWGHFGDLGRIDDDGYLRIVGRLKEVINRGGKKISVNEVENHVRAFPGVRDVAAVGYDDPELGERCCAVVVTEGDVVLTLDALRTFLGKRGVPKHMWPERIHHLDELPMSPQGKVRRRELRELYMLGLTERHEALRERVHAQAEEHIVPVLVETDADERYPREVFAAFGAAGLLGGTLPAAYGGAGMDNVELTVMCEELGRYSQPIAGLIGGVSTVFGTGLMRYGTEQQRRRYLIPYARGETTGALALTERRSGSDARGMECTATKVDGGWALDGGKAWIDSAGVADWFIVFARAEAGITAFVVERGTPGFTTREYRNKHGWRPSSVGELRFARCELSDEALLGEPGNGYRVALVSVGYGRLQVAARHCGGIRACLDESVAWAKERKLYGHPIAQFQLIQTKIVDMSLALDTSRYLTYRFARLLDLGEQARKEGSMAKVYTAEALMRSTHDAVQIQGARGIGEESLVGRMFKDAKVSEIVEGANEVQRTLIAEYELGIRQ